MDLIEHSWKPTKHAGEQPDERQMFEYGYDKACYRVLELIGRDNGED